jgi:hypothetical protein
LPTLPFFANSSLPGWDDYKCFLSALHSSSFFDQKCAQFWESAPKILNRQGNLLCWYYGFAAIEALFLGNLSKYYGTIKEWWGIGPIYAWVAEKVLLRHISEWHAIFTPFTFPVNPKVTVNLNVLTNDDHLYRGEIGDYHVNGEGKLTGIFLSSALRFDRNTYLSDKENKSQKEKGEYWKAIPGKNLYIAADRISTLNVSYDSDSLALIKEAVEQFAKLFKVKVSEIVPEASQEDTTAPTSESIALQDGKSNSK